MCFLLHLPLWCGSVLDISCVSGRECIQCIQLGRFSWLAAVSVQFNENGVNCMVTTFSVFHN